MTEDNVIKFPTPQKFVAVEFRCSTCGARGGYTTVEDLYERLADSDGVIRCPVCSTDERNTENQD